MRKAFQYATARSELNLSLWKKSKKGDRPLFCRCEERIKLVIARNGDICRMDLSESIRGRDWTCHCERSVAIS